MEMNETEQLQKGLQRFQPSIPFRVGAPLGELVEKAIEKDPRIVYYVESWEVSSTPGYYVLIPKYRNRETKRESIETALSQWDCERLMCEYVRQFKKKLVMISKDVVKAQRLIELFYERYTTFYPNLTRICGATYPCRAGAVIIEFSFEYRIGQVRLEQMELEVNTEVQRISRMLFTPGMPTEAKVYLAHNYLATTVEYLKNHDNRLKMSYTPKFIVAMQNIQQIIEGYGYEKAYSILSGFGTSIAFKVTDKATKEFIQNLYGTNRKRFVFKGASYSEGNKELVTYSNVVEDWDLLALKPGEAILSVSDYETAPMKFKFREG